MMSISSIELIKGGKMNIYLINNNKDNQKFEKKFKCMEDAKHWVINTLDLSKNWNILLIDGDVK